MSQLSKKFSAVNTFLTSLFRVQDSSDASKQLSLNVAAITTATTRTITVGDENINVSTGASSSFAAKNLSNVSGGTLAIASGGTGQTTANAAFNALSPMTTGGDIIYGGASGVATRLANGSNGQVLTSAGGTSAPTWATAGSSGPSFTTWASYTPTITGFGTPTTVTFNWMQIDKLCFIQGRFTSGNPTAVVGSFTLPNSLTVKSGMPQFPYQLFCGNYLQDNTTTMLTGYVSASSGDSVMKFNRSIEGGIVSAYQIANQFLGNGNTVSFFVTVPVN